MTDPTPSESRNAFLAVVVVVFVDFLGYGILIPIVPLYAEQFGASEFVVGLLIASYALMQFVFAPVLGRASDRYGRRPVILVTIAGNAAAYVLFGLAGSLATLFAARLLSGVMSGNVAVAQAAVGDLLPRERRAKGFGVLGAAFGMGLVFGPALGGVFSDPAMVALVRRLLPAGGAFVTPFSLPSFVTALVAGTNLLLAAALLPETGGGGSTGGDGLAGVRRLLDDRLLSGLVLSYAGRSLAYSSMVSMFVVFTADLYGFGPSANGYLLAYVGVVVSVSQGLLVDPIVARVGEFDAVTAAAALEAACLAAVPFSPVLGGVLFAVPPVAGASAVPAEVVALLLVVGALAATDAFTTVGINTLISTVSAAGRQGENLGFAQSGDGLARAVGPVVAGALYTGVGYWAPFVAGGAVMVPVAGLSAYLAGRHRGERTAQTST